MRVLKFGGTSVGSAERMRGVAEIVAGQAQEGPLLVVVSAVGGVTDALLKGAEQAAAGGSVVPALSRFHSVHREILALLRAELEPEGFVFQKSLEFLPWQHVIVFTSP